MWSILSCFVSSHWFFVCDRTTMSWRWDISSVLNGPILTLLSAAPLSSSVWSKRRPWPEMDLPSCTMSKRLFSPHSVLLLTALVCVFCIVWRYTGSTGRHIRNNGLFLYVLVKTRCITSVSFLVHILKCSFRSFTLHSHNISKDTSICCVQGLGSNQRPSHDWSKYSITWDTRSFSDRINFTCSALGIYLFLP